MNGYFYVLTTIDLFVLCFMCVLTRLSESLNEKQKRGFFLCVYLDCVYFYFGSCYLKSGWFTNKISLVKYYIELSWVWTYTIRLYLSSVCIGSKDKVKVGIKACDFMRNHLSFISCDIHSIGTCIFSQ